MNEQELIDFLSECCNARKSHAVEYRKFIGLLRNIFGLSEEDAEDCTVGLLRAKKAATLTFGGSCYLYNL